MFTRSTKGQVLYIRHGETHYNSFLEKSETKKDVQTDEKFLDCSLNEEGREQAHKLAENLKNLNFKYVFCSPLNRCLETIQLSLKAHPRRENIIVYVHPLITEVVNGAQDLSKNFSKKKEIFNSDSDVKFDWTLFDLLYDGQSQETYFLDFVDNIFEGDEEILKIIKKLKSGDHREGLYNKFLSYFIYNDKRPESLAHLFERSNNFKQFLRIFLDDNKHLIKDEKILVVTHSAFIRMSTTEKGHQMERVDCYPEDCCRPKNCEVISVNVTDDEMSTTPYSSIQTGS
jgi:broad specificity phosphatase PhoE